MKFFVLKCGAEVLRVKRNLFKLFISKVIDYPLWVKQAIFRKLYSDMEENDSADEVINSPDKIYALFEPVITFQGESELRDKKNWLDNNIYNFLRLCRDNYSLLEISLNTFLSLEETSKLFMFCVEQGYIEKPLNKMAYAVGGFISGKFRTGEYFLEKGSITKSQLEEVLEISKSQNRSTGEVLVEENLVSKDEIRRLFIFKDDAKKRFILNSNVYPTKTEMQISEKEKFENEIKKLKSENEVLKNRMGQLLKLVSVKND